VRLWGGRFTGTTDPRAADYTRSIELDQALALDDLAGSLAHVRGLAQAGILTEDELEVMVGGLEALREEVEAGRFRWDPELEDVHLNLEAALAERIGDVAGKLHTGRSRNDQVATDLRLWLRRTIDQLDSAILALQQTVLTRAEREIGTVMPGATHLQPAQPVLFAHHLLAYVEMLERDRGRLADARRRTNLSPLGAGALAGAGFPLDREAIAAELGFDGPSPNSIDAVSDRDFAAEALAAFALTMIHLSRMAEELTWWSSPHIGYLRLAEAFSTGSSMMPNKRNPDPAELVRARAGRVIGELAGLLAVLKGLPLGYQRDLQEGTEPLFRAAATLDASLGVMRGIFETLEIDHEAMRRAAGEGHTTATAVADELVRCGVPFRVAHAIVGRLVTEAEAQGAALGDLPDASIGSALAASDDERARGLAQDEGMGARLRAAATVEAAIAAANVVGGTAPERVRAALEVARQRSGG
jgi:argininosuccinate lyase